MKKMRKRFLAAAIAVLLVVTLLAACGGNEPTDPGPGTPPPTAAPTPDGGGETSGATVAYIDQGVDDDEIRIGMVFPVSGWAAFFGVPIRDAAQAVIERANAHGGIGGREINFIFYDDGGDPFQGHVLIETLLEEYRVFSLMGMSGGQAAMSLEYMLDFGVPILGMTGGAGFLYSEYNPGGRLFNIQPSNFIDSPLLLARILTTPVFGADGDDYFPEDGRIGFITGPTEAGFDLVDALMEVADGIGVSDQIIVEHATADIYPTIIHQFMTQGVDTLIYAGMGGMDVVGAMYDAGWQVPVFATYGLSTITSWSTETYSPQRRLFANIWAEDTSPAAIAMLEDMRDSLNYLPGLSAAEADGYVDNGFARAGYLLGKVAVIALERMEALGLDWSWENLVVAMEYEPFVLGGTPDFSFANGRRMGVESLALWEFWVNDAGEAEVGIISGFDSFEEILAPWRARTGR